MAEANKPVPKATISVYGKVRMKTAPANPADPIAVGDNDPRLGSVTVLPFTSAKGIVAGVVQTQAGATQLTKFKNIVETVTTTGDGIKASSATENMWQFIQNRCGNGNDFNLYPTLGQNFFGLAVNVPIPIADGNGIEIYCYEGEAGTLRYN